MKNSQPFNMIIAGVGGQGVVSLTKTFLSLCEKQKIQVQGSTYKGGAQQLGSIHSVLRLFLKPNSDYQRYSTQILQGELDLIIGLEPWETIRYSRYFSKKTQVISNSKILAIETERYQKREFKNPVDQLTQLDLHKVIEDFSENATQRFGTNKMTNFVVAERAIDDKLIPFHKTDFIETFLTHVPKMSESLKAKIKEDGHV